MAFHRYLLAVALVANVHGSGCTTSPRPSGDGGRSGPPQVLTTFYPTTYFTERIGGGFVRVVCPLPADADPIFWMPGTDVIQRYQSADLIVINGAGFERWIGKVSLPLSKLVDTSRPIHDELLTYEGVITHSHGPGGEHSHEGIDGHTWLDPQLAKQQADHIRAALVGLLPEHADQITANFQALAADLDALDEALAALSAKAKDQHLLASHPAYNYLAKRYGWTLTNLDLDPEKMPDEQQFAELREKLAGEEKSPTVILWETAPLQEIADRLQNEFGVRSVVFTPCEQLSEEASGEDNDYLDVMRRNIEHLGRALGQDG